MRKATKKESDREYSRRYRLRKRLIAAGDSDALRVFEAMFMKNGRIIRPKYVVGFGHTRNAAMYTDTAIQLRKELEAAGW